MGRGSGRRQREECVNNSRVLSRSFWNMCIVRLALFSEQWKSLEQAHSHRTRLKKAGFWDWPIWLTHTMWQASCLHCWVTKGGPCLCLMAFCNFQFTRCFELEMGLMWCLTEKFTGTKASRVPHDCNPGTEQTEARGCRELVGSLGCRWRWRAGTGQVEA